jgi:hypothetical protein
MLCGVCAKVDLLPQDSADTGKNRRIDVIGNHTYCHQLGLARTQPHRRSSTVAYRIGFLFFVHTDSAHGPRCNSSHAWTMWEINCLNCEKYDVVLLALPHQR